MHVRDILLNQARNLNRTSLAKGKRKEKKEHTNKQLQLDKQKQKEIKEQHIIIGSNNSGDDKYVHFSVSLKNWEWSSKVLLLSCEMIALTWILVIMRTGQVYKTMMNTVLKNEACGWLFFTYIVT